jgi:hypothetical protein
MAQNKTWQDDGIGEQLLELGKSTAKATVKGIAQSFNPLQPLFEKKDASNPLDGKNAGMEKIMKEKEKNSHTPLDFNKLENKYKDQDKAKLEIMRNKLFQMVKSGEEKAIMERKKEEEQRKRKELEAEELKKRQLQQDQAQQNQIAAPQGKVRQTIGAAHKKKSMEQHQEVKANASKQ